VESGVLENEQMNYDRISLASKKSIDGDLPHELSISNNYINSIKKIRLEDK
jgi:hypothetical protein